MFSSSFVLMLSTCWHDPRSGDQRDERSCSSPPVCQKRARIPHASVGFSLRSIISACRPTPHQSLSIPEEDGVWLLSAPHPTHLAHAEIEAQGDPSWSCSSRATMMVEWPLAHWGSPGGNLGDSLAPDGWETAPQTEAKLPDLPPGSPRS